MKFQIMTVPRQVIFKSLLLVQTNNYKKIYSETLYMDNITQGSKAILNILDSLQEKNTIIWEDNLLSPSIKSLIFTNKFKNSLTDLLLAKKYSITK